MKMLKTAGRVLAECIVVLALITCSGVQAQSEKVFLPEAHAPAGIMGDHRHEGGEWMLGYRYMTRDFSGIHQGKDEIDLEEVAHEGFSMVATGMHMEMHMLDIMYAPSDRVTLMLMPSYMSMDMDMTTTPLEGGAGHMDMEAGHGADHGMGGHSHSVSGIGDTSASALIGIAGEGTWKLHATLGISIPTGSVSRKTDEDLYTHYGMQPGSGTWDFLPGLTYSARQDAISWGAQISAVLRLENRNTSGFRFGNRYDASAWMAYRASPSVSLSVRLAYQREGIVDGHYDGPHNHASPQDRQPNYGGKFVDAGLGLNLVPQAGPLAGVRLGIEWLDSLDADYNGIQVGRQDSLNLSLGYAF